tara:strand:+ start:89 stop:1324 length:1236 start_codon:yes stop_codon:yes gene_type:complete
MCTRSSTLREHQQRLLRDNDDATTTTTTTSEQLPPRLVRLVKRALLLVASAKCNGETESKSIRRLGEFIREKRGKEKEDKEEDKVLSFLETQMTKRRGTPTAKSLLRLTCIQKEEEEEEDEERRTAATTTSHSSTAGKKEEERKRREDLYFMEWRSAFYEQLWMEERKLREEKIVLAKKATTSLMSSSAVLSPDGPLSMGDEYARTPSTAGKTSASSVDDEEDDGEDNTARSGSKCDYRDWNAITRSPILKNTMNTPQQRAAHSNRSGVDDGNLTLPVTNLLRTLVLKEEEEDKEEDKEDKDKEEELREGGAITPRPIDKNNLDDDENVQFEFRTPDQASKSKKDPQHLTPPGAPLRVRNDFRRVDEMHREAHFGGWKTNERRAASGTVFEDLLKDAEDDEGDQAPRRSLF